MKFLLAMLILFNFTHTGKQFTADFSEENREHTELEISEKAEKEADFFQHDSSHAFNGHSFNLINKYSTYSNKSITVINALISMIKSFHYPNAPPV